MGLGFRTKSQTVRTDEGKPRVGIVLERLPYPGEWDQGFAPLGIPEVLECVLTDLDPRVLRSGSVSFTARLKPGRHEFPIVGESSLVVDVPRDTKIFGAIDLGPSRSEPDGQECIVREINLEFDRALVLGNVVEALVEVQRLFVDRKVKSLVSSLSDLIGNRAPPAFKKILESVESQVTDGSMEPGEVHLQSVKVRPKVQGPKGLQVLEPSFSGHVKLLDRVTSPFWDVVLPVQVLPAMYASLDRLASGSPLASADIRSLPDLLPVLRSLKGTLEEVEGDLQVETLLPVINVHGEAVDRTLLDTEASFPRILEAAGRFEAHVKGDGLRLKLPRFTAHFPGHPEARLGGALTADIGLDLETSEIPAQRRVTVEARLNLRKGSRLPPVDLELQSVHPLARGGVATGIRFEDLALWGGVGFQWSGERVDFSLGKRGMSLEGRISMAEQTLVRRARRKMSGVLEEGRFKASLKAGKDGSWEAAFKSRARLDHRFEMQVIPIPELAIEDSTLAFELESTCCLEGGAHIRFPDPGKGGFTLTPSGTLGLRLIRGEGTLDGRRVVLPRGTDISGKLRQGEVSSTGISDLDFDVSWDLHGKPCMLYGSGRSTSLLTDDLRKGDLSVLVNPAGRFSFRGDQEGLYGVRFFNALLDPAAEPRHVLEILRSDDALSHVIAAIEVINPDVARDVTMLRRWILKIRDLLEEEGIREPGDVIPRARIARILSLVLAGDHSLEERLIPLIKDMTEGKGLNLKAAKSLLAEPLGDMRLDYEVDSGLRWLDLVTKPSEPIPETEPEMRPPQVEEPRFQDALEGWPSADEIYRVVDSGEVSDDFLWNLARMAPHLTLGQIDYILKRRSPRWPARISARLHHVREAKRKVARIQKGYGGLAYAGQAAAIAGFLGEAVGPLRDLDPGKEKDTTWPPPCALGSLDVAILLQAGLAEGRQTLEAQINNRLLLDLIRSRSGEFLLSVFVEMSHQVPRILTGVLFSFLHQDQNQMRKPLDLVKLLQEKTGLTVPRQEDYLAGGRRARKSYFEALSTLAEGMFEQAGPYLARRAWLREVNHPVPTAPRATGTVASLSRDAQASIASADRLSPRLSFGGRSTAEHKTARRAYQTAFDACAALLVELPTAFQFAWFRKFWARNEEALKVLSVVRNHQQDIDDVRHWLSVMTGGKADVRTEQALVETVVRTLYYRKRDQNILLADPLVRLLLDPAPGHYDFTVVGCMGVVTDGAEGRELEDTYGRLLEQRGVHAIRAHTGLFRSLEYNASAIIRAARRSRTPWGYIGYSQGCANALLAESFLRGGSPDEQRLLDRLVCRNLVFSAANGSVHGTSGALKFQRAMIEGERFLKHYQASYSQEIRELVFRAMKSTLDSSLFVKTLSGTFSLGQERAAELHRDGQFAPWVPTSTTRGIITPERLPEALEYLYYVHERLLPGRKCDSQVSWKETVGYSTMVRNARTEVLKRCDMGSLVQSTHHWSPLTAEVEFITTDRDRERAVYEGPKDRHVFPWIEVNARFGLIRRR